MEMAASTVWGFHHFQDNWRITIWEKIGALMMLQGKSLRFHPQKIRHGCDLEWLFVQKCVSFSGENFQIGRALNPIAQCSKGNLLIKSLSTRGIHFLMCLTHGTTSTSLASTFTSGPITITILKVKTTKLKKGWRRKVQIHRGTLLFLTTRCCFW